MEPQTSEYKYVAMYYDNTRKEVTLGMYGIFDTVEDAENYLVKTIIKPEEDEVIVEIDRKCHIQSENEKYAKIDIDLYVLMSEDRPWIGEKYGEFVKGLMCVDAENVYYGSTVYAIVKTPMFKRA